MVLNVKITMKSFLIPIAAAFWSMALILAIPLSAAAETPHQPIRVVMDNNYPPYVFTDDSGRLEGILIDQWKLWEKKTGIHVEITGMDWNMALSQMAAGDFDVIDTIFKNEQRERIFDFSKPYARIGVQIFFQKNISGITDAASARGFTVAVKSGDAAVDYLIRNGVNRLVQYNSYENIVRAAKSGAVTVFIMDRPPAMYFLYKLRIQNQFRYTRPLYSGEFHRAVLKDHQQLLETVETGFSRISVADLNRIDRKWFGSPTSVMVYLRYFGVSAACAVLIGLILLTWNWTLRRLVRKKTVELKTMADLSVKRAEALQVSEEKYRLLVENADVGIVIVCKNQIRFVNQKLKTMIGYSDNELIGKHFLSFAHSDDREQMKRLHALRIKGKNSSQTYSIRLLTRNGDTVWVEVNTISIVWETKPAVLGFLRDVTHEKELECQLVNSQKMEAIGTLAGGVAHEFNNMLMGIQGYTSLILMDTDHYHPHYDKLKHIEKQIQSASNLTRQLLEFARGGQYRVEPVRLNDMIRNCAEMFGRAKKGVTFHYNLADDLLEVEADKGQIEQVLLNILLNAWQAMSSGGDVLIETRNVPIDSALADVYQMAPGAYAAVMIKDSGIGMDDATRQRVFDPFFSTRGMGKGAGLGLASAYGIIRNHKGVISVTSEPGKGACFTFYLPKSDIL